MASITIDELRSFHRIDRVLYTRFALRFRLDAILCMQIFALWLWLERLGYPDIVMKLIPLSDAVVIAVVEEAVACLIFLQSDIPPVLNINPMLPMTRSLMQKDISLQFIYANRVQAVNNITKIVHDICIRAFEDIAQEALSRPAWENIMVPQSNVSSGGAGGSGSGRLNNGGVAHESLMGDVTLPYPTTSLGRGLLGRPVFQHPLIVLPTPTYYPPEMKIKIFQQGESSSTPSTPSFWNTAGTSSSSNLNPGSVPYNPTMSMMVEVPKEERTVLVTFSRGYPITEEEIRQFFTREFGDCIKSLQMQKVIPHIQPLYALLVLYSGLDMDLILGGKETVKLTINSKDVLVRRYAGKQKASS